MTEKDWDEIDSSSRQVFQSFLRHLGYSEIKGSTGLNSMDITGKSKKGKIHCFELKDRNLLSSTYNDHIIDMDKFKGLDNRKLKYNYDKIFIVSFFRDGVMVINNLYDEDRKVFGNRANETTMIKGVKSIKKLKQQISYPQKHKISIEKTAEDYKFRLLH